MMGQSTTGPTSSTQCRGALSRLIRTLPEEEYNKAHWKVATWLYGTLEVVYSSTTSRGAYHHCS